MFSLNGKNVVCSRQTFLSFADEAVMGPRAGACSISGRFWARLIAGWLAKGLDTASLTPVVLKPQCKEELV